jgi:transcription regulator MmyB-like protein
MAADTAAVLRIEAGRNPHDKGLTTLVGELSMQNGVFRRAAGRTERHVHHRARKRLLHLVVGEL